MKKTIVYIFLIATSLVNNLSLAQDPLQLLNEVYNSYKSFDSYRANYEMQYLSDLDTGQVTSENIEMIMKDGQLRINNPAFISITNATSKLYIDHLEKEVTFIPILFSSTQEPTTTDYLSFYIPEETDDIQLIDGTKYYTLIVKPDKKIRSIEYQIEKKSKDLISIRMKGQVHPLLLEDLNAEFYVKILNFNKGKSAKIQNPELNTNAFIVKSDGTYELLQYTDYNLQVLE